MMQTGCDESGRGRHVEADRETGRRADSWPAEPDGRAKWGHRKGLRAPIRVSAGGGRRRPDPNRPPVADFSVARRPGGAGYGFGFQAGKFFGHGGGAPGMNGDLAIFPDTGYVVVVLSNLDPPAAGRVANFIRAHLPRT